MSSEEHIPLHELISQQATPQVLEAYVMELLRHGRIGSGYAAKLLGLSRLEILDRMGQYQISVFSEQTSEELAQEVANTLKLIQPNL